MSTKSDYSKLAKKHKLPKWAWLEENFKIKDEGRALEAVRLAIIEKIESACVQIIEPMISGHENYSSWFERQMLSKNDMEKLFDIYKHFQSLLWGANFLSLEGKEKDYANWIKNVKKIWDKDSPALAKIAKKLEASWQKYKKKEITTLYHG